MKVIPLTDALYSCRDGNDVARNIAEELGEGRDISLDHIDEIFDEFVVVSGYQLRDLQKRYAHLSVQPLLDMSTEEWQLLCEFEPELVERLRLLVSAAK